MSRSVLDTMYRKLLLSKFFIKGWGKPENLNKIFGFRKIMANKELCYKLVDPETPVQITKVKNEGAYMIYEGHFTSPFEQYLPGLLPEKCKKAYFQMLLPHTWQRQDYRPVCIHLAGTGDHGYWKRRSLMARPLLSEHGIASILLENPFYGSRKPPEQKRSSLLNVSDLFVMGGCLIMECMVLMHWCKKLRLGPVGLSGISMGGHMASLAACGWPHPIPLVPCLSWTTASGVFTQGVLSGAINWDLLKNQYLSNSVFREELFNLIDSPEGQFAVYNEVGRVFARDYPESLDKVQESSPPPNTSQPTATEGCTATPSVETVNSHFPPQFSHIDSQSNALNALDTASMEINMEGGSRETRKDSSVSDNLDGSSSRGREGEGEKPPLHMMTGGSGGAGNYPNSSRLQSSQQEIPPVITTKYLRPINVSKIKQYISEQELIKGKLAAFYNMNHLFEVLNANSANDNTSSETTEPSKSSLLQNQPPPNTEQKRKISFAERTKRILHLPSSRPKVNKDDPHLGFTPVGVRPCNSNLDSPKLVSFKPYVTVKDPMTWEAVQFMRGIMDECTHVCNYGMPTDNELIIIIQATRDAYMPSDSMKPLNEAWPGSELRTVDTGHITAFLLHQNRFREAINDAFQRTFRKYGATTDFTDGGRPPIPPDQL